MFFKAVGFVVCAAAVFGAYKGTVEIVDGTGDVNSVPNHVTEEFQELGVPVAPQGSYGGGYGYDDPRDPDPYNNVPYRDTPLDQQLGH